MAQTNLKQSPDQIFGASSHSRSLSQPSFMANNCLPPLSPFPPSESSLASSNSSLKNTSMEETDVSSRGPAMGLTSPRENPFRGSGLPPRRGHRRSNSDVPLGFSAMIQSSPQLVPISSQGGLGQMTNTREKSGNSISAGMNKLEVEEVNYAKSEDMGERKSEGEVVDNLFQSLMDLDHGDTLNSSGANGRDRGTLVRGTTIAGGDSNVYESESLKKNAAVAPQIRHFRSLSMDSGIGSFQFGDSPPNLQNSLCNRADQLSPSNSLSENLTDINLDFGHGEFNEVELRKIRADDRLAEIAVSDPKRAKRILANRQSAARSKERKLRYISELEHKVQTLQTEATTLSAQITIVQKDHAELTNQNNELKFRIHAMEQQAQLRDALHETLTSEVQRLKFGNMELRDEGRTSNGMAPTKHNLFSLQRQQPNQVQRLPVTTSTSTTAPTAPASA
ncbi:bZIP transcription factor 29-like [Salvia miltiorrhiza]|uniref:bZIP transcription factor 29-like n=1 Tax=Salvia miltiorrhiza TaxID=226208 RepID=UPI0025ABF366|nr:bZIP transcription factor 29-like [Salvia miltiorrhiza]XP_057766070.1 bZIP transcription factor 29-like [Salvia miltiorrhiza]